jgi:hypothetical protein
VTIPGFGSFKKRHRAARKGRNPSTGADMDIPAKDSPAFSAGSVFKGVVQTGNWEAYDETLCEFLHMRVVHPAGCVGCWHEVTGPRLLPECVLGRSTALCVSDRAAAVARCRTPTE